MEMCTLHPKFCLWHGFGAGVLARQFFMQLEQELELQKFSAGFRSQTWLTSLELDPSKTLPTLFLWFLGMTAAQTNMHTLMPISKKFI